VAAACLACCYLVSGLCGHRRLPQPTQVQGKHSPCPLGGPSSQAPTYPAQFSSVISVAAHDGQDPFGLDANPAPPADFGAPGIDIPVPWLSGSTIVATGNSFAAAHVTGLVTRMLSKHPHLRPYEVKTVLRAVASNAVASGSQQ